MFHPNQTTKVLKIKIFPVLTTEDTSSSDTYSKFCNFPIDLPFVMSFIFAVSSCLGYSCLTETTFGTWESKNKNSFTNIIFPIYPCSILQHSLFDTDLKIIYFSSFKENHIGIELIQKQQFLILIFPDKIMACLSLTGVYFYTFEWDFTGFCTHCLTFHEKYSSVPQIRFLLHTFSIFVLYWLLLKKKGLPCSG